MAFILSLRKISRSVPGFRNSTLVPCKYFATDEASSSFKALACPLCFQPVSKRSSSLTAGLSSFSCNSCSREYQENSKGVIDLTIPTASSPFSSTIFQNPSVARIYDRYYRDSFRLWGFPGFQKEFHMAHEILRPCHGRTMMDLSCGGGSLTRRFLTSNAYDLVIASDYSEAMLNECSSSLKTDPDVNIRKLLLVKADAQRLPFTSSSLAAVHSSAALHCWPDPNHAVSEIARLLQPGGIFVASTFLFPQPASSLLNRLVQSLRQALERIECPLRLWTEDELRELVEANGLTEWKSTTRGGAFILFSVSKPC